MLAIVDLFQQGGPWMWVVLLVGLPCLPVSLLCAGLLATGRRVPVGLGLALPVLLLWVGAVGTLTSMHEVMAAIPYASAEMRGVLGHAGFAMALVPEVTALVCGGALLVGFAAVVAGAGAVVKGPGAPALRAESWVGSVLALGVGLASLGFGLWLHGDRMVHQAMAHAAPETVGLFVADGLEWHPWGLGVLGIGAAVLAVGLPVAGGFAGRDLWGRLGASLAGVGVGLVVFAGLHVAAVQAATPLATVWPSTALAGIDHVVSERPVHVDTRGQPHSLPAAWPLDAVRIWTGGQWKPWAAEGRDAHSREGTPLLVAPAQTPAAHLLGAFDPARDGGVVVLTQPPGAAPSADTPAELRGVRHRGLYLTWATDLSAVGRVEESAAVLALGPDRVEVVVAGEVVARVSGVAAAAAALQQHVDAGLGTARGVWLFPGPGWSLQDVVTLCLSGRDPIERSSEAACGLLGEVPVGPPDAAWEGQP